MLLLDLSPKQLNKNHLGASIQKEGEHVQICLLRLPCILTDMATNLASI